VALVSGNRSAHSRNNSRVLIPKVSRVTLIAGETKSRKETAVNLLNMGIDVGIISQATGFDEKEIKQLTAL